MIELVPTIDRENFIVNIQAAFKKAVVETYGDDGISRRRARKFWTLSATARLSAGRSS